MTRAMAFVAALVLGLRDGMRQSWARDTGRNHLLGAADCSEEAFLAAGPSKNAGTLLLVRGAIACFFEVPASKVARTVHLTQDLHADALVPGLHIFVLGCALEGKTVEPGRVVGIRTSDVHSLDEFADAVDESLSRLKQA